MKLLISFKIYVWNKNDELYYFLISKSFYGHIVLGEERLSNTIRLVKTSTYWRSSFYELHRW